MSSDTNTSVIKPYAYRHISLVKYTWPITIPYKWQPIGNMDEHSCIYNNGI